VVLELLEDAPAAPDRLGYSVLSTPGSYHSSPEAQLRSNLEAVQQGIGRKGVF